MKKAIDLLEDAYKDVFHSGIVLGAEIIYRRNAMEKIKAAIAELKDPPRWETPEQREQRTEEPWPDNWAVYIQIIRKDNGYIYKWKPCTFREALINKSSPIWENHQIEIVCATEAGPPPDDWRPEEEAQ
jgi:hypothetical protein